jgi:G3E family GTPase
VNKIDRVPADQLPVIAEKLTQINSAAIVYETKHSVVELDKILGLRAFNKLGSYELIRELDDTAVHDHSITSMVLTGGTLIPQEFNKWLDGLLWAESYDDQKNSSATAEDPSTTTTTTTTTTTVAPAKKLEIFRMKGLLRFPEKVCFLQAVQAVYDLIETKDAVDVTGSRVVVIGRNLDKDALIEGFAKCNVDNTTTAVQ